MSEIEETTEVVEPEPVQALHALFDDGSPLPARGDTLPPLWHWVALPQWAPAGGTGADGHPRRGAFLPNDRHTRRMFAGGSVEFHDDLRVGESVRRESRIVSSVEKSGRSGDFTLVTAESLIYGEGGQLAVRELQNLVYREPAAPATAPESPAIPAHAIVPALLTPAGPARWDFRTDPTKLMRFSAATSNGHRIHYDWPYATREEGYPDLVVHGPLMTLSALEAFRSLPDSGRIRSIAHRNLAPLFCGRAAQVTVDGEAGGERELALSSDDGATTNVTVKIVAV